MKKAIVSLAVIATYILMIVGINSSKKEFVFVDTPSTTEPISFEQSVAEGHIDWCMAEQGSKTDFTEQNNQYESFRITVYTPYSDGGRWGYQTASGETSKHLATCAVDTDVIPLGSVVEINGLMLTAVDTGSAVKGNVIDVFYDGTESEARQWIAEFGDYAEVKIK